MKQKKDKRLKRSIALALGEWSVFPLAFAQPIQNLLTMSDLTPPTTKRLGRSMSDWQQLPSWYFLVTVFVIAVGVLLRVAVSALAKSEVTPYDDSDYLGRALWFSVGGKNDCWRAPLQVWFLGFSMRLVNYHFIVVRVGQALVGCLSLPLVWMLARRFLAPIPTLMVLSIVALWPEFILLNTLVMSEAITTVCLLAAGWFTFECCAPTLMFRQFGRGAAAFLAGIMWGLTSLGRDEYIYTAFFIVAWLGWQNRAAFRRVPVLLALGLFLVVAPCSVRNYRVCGTVSITNHGAYAFWQHWETKLSVPELNKVFYAATENEREKLAMKKALQCLRDDPSGVAHRIVKSGFRMFMPDHCMFFPYAFGMFPVWTRPILYGVYWLTALVLVPLFMGVFAAMFDRSTRKDFMLVTIILVTGIFMHALAYGEGRYRIPYTPLLMIMAAAGFGVMRRRLRLAGISFVLSVFLYAAAHAVLYNETRAMFRDELGRQDIRPGVSRLGELMIRHWDAQINTAGLRKSRIAGAPAAP